MHRSLILLPALLAFPLAGCVVGLADGQPYKESLRGSYANFQHVDVAAGVRTIVTQGPFDVKAEVVKGDTLHVSRKSSLWNMGGPEYLVKISAPDFKSFDVSSGASLKGGNLALKDLDVGVSSGASVTLDGACTALHLDVSSGASFDGEALRCDTANVDASSGGSANAFATMAADGEASSGASVTFYGKPAQFREDSSSGGSVRAR